MITLLVMLTLVIMALLVVAVFWGGSALRWRHRERQFSREVARVVASLTEEEVSEWLA